MTSTYDLIRLTLDSALAADFASLGEDYDPQAISKLADVLEDQFLPALKENSFRDEIDICILWFGMRKLASDYIPDVKAIIIDLRGKDWIKMREVSVTLSKLAMQHHYRDRFQRHLLAA